MTDPFRTVLALNQALLESWLNSSALMMRVWEQTLGLHEHLIHQADEIVRCRFEIDDGPSFIGKYGKRHHDIDPERDV